MSNKNLRYLLGYSHYEYEFNIREWVEGWVNRLRAQGIDVQGYCMTLNPPGGRLTSDEIEERYRRKDPELMKFYEDLSYTLESYDVFVNWNGINTHPEFVKSLSTFNVYGCFDDPESTEHLSKPVAAAYDLCMVGNIAEIDQYKSWGVKEAHFWPNGFRINDYDPNITEEQILTGIRGIPVTMMCERESPWRRERLDKFASAHPGGAYFGKGWPNGFLPEADRIPLLQKTKIGINIHNSTGPINFRTFYLPANGVLQVCDNKQHLGKIFELGKEVIGYDSMEEAIDLVHYYLQHDDERKQIALNGYRRTMKDYNEIEVFRTMINHVERIIDERAAIAQSGNQTSEKSIIVVDNSQRSLLDQTPPLPGKKTGRGKVFLHQDLLYPADAWYRRFEFVLQTLGIEYECVNLLEDNYFEFLKRIGTNDCLIGRFGHDPRDLQVIRPKYGHFNKVFANKIFPSFDQYFYYDDKKKQTEFFLSNQYPTPASQWVQCEKDLKTFMEVAHLQFPIVLKQSQGAGSSTVKLARSLEEVSYPTIAQEFCDNNDRDLRLNVIGHRVMGFERLNRDNDFRASGSGRIVYPNDFDPQAMNLVFEISLKHNFECMAYDLVKRNGEWVIVEMSYAFLDTAVLNSPFYYDMRTGQKISKVNIYPEDFILQDFLKKYYGIEFDLGENKATEPRNDSHHR
jgi:spore maturation protein CgeB